MRRLGAVVFRSAAPRALALVLLGGAGLFGACTTDHDSLAKKPPATPSGGSGGSAGLNTGNTGNFGNQSQGGRTNPDFEPPGDNVLTIVNGVVDAPSVRLCFARLDEGSEASELVGSPEPELAYAGTRVLQELPGLSLAEDAIQPWVIAGDLDLIADVTCEQAVAKAQADEAQVTPDDDVTDMNVGGSDDGPWADLPKPKLRARRVAALPAGTVNVGRSILLVLTGCLGGPGYGDRVETAVCGDDYSPAFPTLQPLVVKLSRSLSFDKVGLQALHASLPTSAVDVRAAGDRDAIALVLASTLSFGAIEPRPADTRFTPVELGVTAQNYGLQAMSQRGDILLEQAWPDILAASGIDEIKPARTYTAVLLGPAPLLAKKGWWNPSAFSLVDNDPTRE